MMNDLSFDRGSEWDLQAIVKGGSSVTSSCNTTNMSSPCYDAWFESLLGLEDYQENTTFIFNNELEQVSNNHCLSSNISSSKIFDSSMVMNFDVYTSSPIDEPKEKAIDVSHANTRATLLKRRKNKHKIIKVVQQEGGDRSVSDKWNWRKYGEKVIKGSPYPRSYYRCSYSGGCLARKQVEQSISDPGLFLITYMEEHSHPYPTRRHSQAGRSARRFIHSYSPTKVVTTNETHNALVDTLTLKSSTNDDRDLKILQGKDDDDGNSTTNSVVGEGAFCMANRVNEDDFFAGLDYLEELKKGFCD